MAAAPPAGTSETDAARGEESYIGSFIRLISKSDIRYEGFLSQLNTQESTLCLRNVKSFGTEGRSPDGTQVAPSDRIYQYIYFRGSDIKDLQVISSPSVQSTPTVPDDPAIIQLHCAHPTSTTISTTFPGALGGQNLSSNAQLGNQVRPFQGNMAPLQSVEVSGSWASVVPAPPVNFHGPAMQSYWPGFTGLPGGISHFQQQTYPPSPQGLLLPNPVQRQLPHPSVNPSLARNALNFAKLPRTLLPPVCTGSPNLICTVSPPSTLLPPVCTGSLNLISTMSPPSTAQYSHIPLVELFSNLSSTPMSNNASNPLPSEMVVSGCPVSSPVTTVDVKPAVPVTDQAPSLLGPAPFPMISKFRPSFIGSSSSSHGKIHEGVSSSYYGRRHHGQGRGDMIYGDMHHHYPSNRGHVQGRGRGNVPNRAASQNYQTYRGHPVGRGSGLIGTASYPPHVTGGPGRENAPNTVTPYYRRYAGSPAWGDSEAVTNFSEDFDFEAMNEKFNKKEVWDLLGKTKQAGSEDTKEDEKEGDGREGADESGDGSPKPEHKYNYCKDDFFDSISCAALDAEARRGKMKFSELRRVDAETFGDVLQPRRGHGFQGPYRGGGFQGSNRGRGYDNAGRGRMKTVWNRVTP